MAKPEKFARCYAPGANMRSPDYVPISVADARELVRDGLAELVNHNKDIRMFSRKIIRLRDRSCSWSHRLMDLVVDGDSGACALLETINPHTRGTRELLLLSRPVSRKPLQHMERSTAANHGVVS